MKNNLIIILFLILSNSVLGQNIDFNVVVLDTSEHFNPSPYTSSQFDANLIIDNDSIFKEVFRWSPFNIGHPKFTEVIWLKRTIRVSCLSKIENTVTIDSVKRTVTWNITVKSKNCERKVTRHIVIQIPAPPINYDVVFDTSPFKNGIELNEINNSIINDLKVSSFQCEPPTLFRFSTLDSKRLVIDNDSLFSYWKKEGMDCEKPNFRKNLILANSYWGDCHMHLMPHAFFDPITNILVLNVYNIWGGCRAGGHKSITVLVERPKENFNVVFQEIQLESWSEYEQHSYYTRKVDIKK